MIQRYDDEKKNGLLGFPILKATVSSHLDWSGLPCLVQLLT